jgi:tetratricopeptide (TPR) repeat protein
MNQEQELSQAEYDYYWSLSLQERNQLLESDQISDSIRVLLLLRQGEQLAEIEEFDAAIASYDKAVKIQSNFSRIWANRGYALANLSRYEEAIDSYDKAVEIQPDYSWAWGGRGNALGKLKRYEEAILSFDKALEIGADDYWLWVKKASALLQLTHYEEAILSFDRVVKIKPDDDWSWTARGYTLANLNRYEEAVVSYDRAIAIQPDSYWPWVERGDALAKLNRDEEAVVSYDTASEKEPHLKVYCDLRRRELIEGNDKLLSYLANRWARGNRTFRDNLRLIYSIFPFPIILCTALILILLFKSSFLGQILKEGLSLIFTGLALFVILIALIELKQNTKLPYRIYLKSGFLSYIRAFFTCLITIAIVIFTYTYSPEFLRFGWGKLIFSGSGNWGIIQPFEVANQAAETANTVQDKFIHQAPEISKKSEEGKANKSEKSKPGTNRFNFRWVFIPILWLLLILVLPFWAQSEEETYRKGVHTWKGMTKNSIKFGLVHLVMGIPICCALSLSVPGFIFACRYKYIYQRHLKKFGDEKKAQEAGVLASTADHAIYNAILVSFLTATFL